MLEHLTDDELAMLVLAPDVTPKLSAVQHIDDCAQCRERVQGVQTTMRAVDTLDFRGVSQMPGLGALRNRIEAELSGAAPKREHAAIEEPPRVLWIPPVRGIERVRAFLPVVVSLVLAWLAGKGSALEPAIGLRCAAVELGAAALMFGAFVLVTRGALKRSPTLKRAVHDRATILSASVAGTGALLGQVWLHQRCEALGEKPHLFVFHVGAVLLASVLATALAPLARKLLV